MIPGLGRSPGEGNGNPLQYSCLENSMDREAWQATLRVGHDWVTNTHMLKIPWSRKWQPILVFLPGKFYGQRNPTGHGVAKSWTWLSGWAHSLYLLLKKVITIILEIFNSLALSKMWRQPNLLFSYLIWVDTLTFQL